MSLTNCDFWRFMTLPLISWSHRVNIKNLIPIDLTLYTQQLQEYNFHKKYDELNNRKGICKSLWWSRSRCCILGIKKKRKKRLCNCLRKTQKSILMMFEEAIVFLNARRLRLVFLFLLVAFCCSNAAAAATDDYLHFLYIINITEWNKFLYNTSHHHHRHLDQYFIYHHYKVVLSSHMKHRRP